MQCGDVEKLIRRRDDPATPPLYFAALEDIYDIVHRAHIATGHGGRDKLLKEVGKKYANITKQAVEVYKEMCEECQKKHKRQKVTGVVVKPILTSDALSRCQVDLLDMQSLPSGQFKYILVYQDHFTKFTLLRPLTSKRATEVAYHLVDIFLNFGAPAILQSDNGAEFTASVISDVAKLWPDLKLVHGKPRQPQSQGSVERANRDIKDMLVTWMSENKTTNWSWGIKFVQFYKNSSLHAGIGSTPFKVMFGVEAKTGLRSTSLPEEIVQIISCEDDLLHAATLSNANNIDVHSDVAEVPSTTDSQTPATSQQSAADMDSSDPTEVVVVHDFDIPLSDEFTDALVHTLDITSASVPAVARRVLSADDDAVTDVNVVPDTDTTLLLDLSHTSDTTLPTSAVTSSDASTVSADKPGTSNVSEPTNSCPETSMGDNDEAAFLSSQINTFHETRKRARAAQQTQAERMLKRSRTNLIPAERGDNVMIPIPLVDRGKGDPRNLIGVVLDRNEHDTYKLGVGKGVLKGRFSRNQFDVCKEQFLKIDSMDYTKSLSVREAVISESIGGGQGYIKCNCVGHNGRKCATNRCKCFKNRLQCNSRCHASLPCKNKGSD